MLLWTMLIIGLILVVVLNIFGTNTVLSSHVTTVAAQRKLIMLIWLIPYLGTILAMITINKAIKRNSNQSKEDMTSSLITLAERFNEMEKEVRKKRTKSTN
jgi:uncharacterized membrane protein